MKALCQLPPYYIYFRPWLFFLFRQFKIFVPFYLVSFRLKDKTEFFVLIYFWLKAGKINFPFSIRKKLLLNSLLCLCR
jgi:hypothetical protein